MSRKSAENRLDPLSAGKRACREIPPYMKRMVDEFAQVAKGKPWFLAHQVMMGLHDVARTTGESQLMVAVLLEKMGASPNRCNDPFQCVVYCQSARKDHQKAGARYLKAHGGKEGVEHEAHAWIDANQSVIESLPTPLKVEGHEIPAKSRPFPTLQEFFDEWVAKARERFEADGTVHPFLVGLLPDGSQFFVTRGPNRNDEEQTAFQAIGGQLINDRGAVAWLRAAEVWMSPEKTVRPKSSSKREEFVLIHARDLTGDDRVARIRIIRDWKTGKGTLGDTEHEQPYET